MLVGMGTELALRSQDWGTTRFYVEKTAALLQGAAGDEFQKLTKQINRKIDAEEADERERAKAIPTRSVREQIDAIKIVELEAKRAKQLWDALCRVTYAYDIIPFEAKPEATPPKEL